MGTLTLLLHVLVCLLLVVVILLQSSKGGGLAGAFGGMGGAGAVFGGRGAASFLTRATTILATIYVLSSLGQGLLSKRQTAPHSVIQEAAQQQIPTTSSPAASLPGLPVVEEETSEEGSAEPQTTSGDAEETTAD